MPGITGIIQTSPSKGRAAEIELMVKSLLHEPFYSSGTLALDPLHLAVGWANHPGAFSDCLPIWNETHDVCLIFWGEHLPSVSEWQDLQSAGHACSGGNTAEFLVHLYEKLGMKFFEALNGTFHGLLVDLREKKAVLFNDRYGLGRLYYHEGPEGFYFSAEAKSLLKVLPQLRRLDTRGLGEFFSCGCALQGRTLFAGVSLLPPGSIWTFRPGRPVQKEVYFKKEAWETLGLLSPDDYYQRLKEEFNRILPKYFGGRLPVALSLTGGLDSRMIIAGVPCAPRTLPCYTFGGMYRESEDVKIGRQVASLCEQPYQVIPVDERFFPQYLEHARRCVYITDGAMDVSGAVGMMVNRQAREIAPVRMTGNYGSEILRGSVMFKPGENNGTMFERQFAATVHQAGDTYRSERQGSRLSFIAFKQVPWFHCCRFSAENSQLTVRSPYLDNELVRLAYQAPPGLLLNKQLAYRYTTDVKPALAGAPTDRGLLKRPAVVPEKMYQLWKERWPKAEYYFDYGMPQWLAKADHALSPLHLERAFLGHQKYYHFRIWYRHELARQIKEVLLDSRTLGRPYLNGRRVEEMVQAHTRGSGNYTSELHRLMSSEFIERQLISMT